LGFGIPRMGKTFEKDSRPSGGVEGDWRRKKTANNFQHIFLPIDHFWYRRAGVGPIEINAGIDVGFLPRSLLDVKCCSLCRMTGSRGRLYGRGFDADEAWKRCGESVSQPYDVRYVVGTARSATR